MHSHFLSSSAQSRQSVGGDDFLWHVPESAVLLVRELNKRGLPLTASGLETMGRQKGANEYLTEMKEMKEIKTLILS